LVRKDDFLYFTVQFRFELPDLRAVEHPERFSVLPGKMQRLIQFLSSITNLETEYNSLPNYGAEGKTGNGFRDNPLAPGQEK